METSKPDVSRLQCIFSRRKVGSLHLLISSRLWEPWLSVSLSSLHLSVHLHYLLLHLDIVGEDLLFVHYKCKNYLIR